MGTDNHSSRLCLSGFSFQKTDRGLECCRGSTKKGFLNLRLLQGKRPNVGRFRSDARKIGLSDPVIDAVIDWVTG
jgi:hypothetical protein